MLPLYKAILNNEEDGILCVSLVDYPATETDFVLFKKQEESIIQKYSVTDEEEHILSSVVMVADTPIYRRDESGYEYNIIYHKDVLKEMAQKMLSDGTHNTFDLMHDGERLPEGYINLIELYIVDESKGIKPNFTDVPDGSLMASYKINNEDLWEACKNGTFKGLSLEGYFTVVPENIEKEQKNKNLFMDILGKLKELIVEFEEVKEEVETPVEEVEVEMEEEQPEDESTEETIEETPDHNDEEESEPETVEETPSELEVKVSELESKFGELLQSVSELGARLEALEEAMAAPVVNPIEEMHEEKPLDKYEAIALALKNK